MLKYRFWGLALMAPHTVLLAQTSGGKEIHRLDAMVVTASRSEQNRLDVPASMEVIDSQKLQDTPGYYITDILKKNASVDVIEYPGGLSGIGLRGFRPQFSGINQRVLILVDGRPAGATSMGNIAAAGIERVEVLKGSASALYGASAMGGVVNFITRKSAGNVSGDAYLGYGSFETVTAGASAGGALGDHLSFDLGLTHRAQNDDFKMGDGGKVYGDFEQGHGKARPNTQFEQNNIFARLAAELAPDWEAQVRVLGYDAPESETPGAESDGVNNQSKKAERNIGGDVSLTGRVGDHHLLALVYNAQEEYEYTDQPPNVAEFVSNTRDIRFTGAQLQDSWAIGADYDLIVGLDYNNAESKTALYNANGSRRGSNTPYFEQIQYGLFADLTSRWFEDRLIFNIGARHDEIESKVLATPMRPDLQPGSEKFDAFNPRAGIVLRPDASSPVRLHASVGTGFIVPEANQIAGLSETVVGSQTRITRGNPDLDPESSESVDIGMGYEGEQFGLDLTWFRLEVDDRISSVITTQTPTLRVTTYENALGSLASGWELTGLWDMSTVFGVTPGLWTGDFSSTYYDKRKEEVSTGERVMNNVARFKINVGFGYDDGEYSLRVGGRHVRGTEDNDFSTGRIFTDGTGGQYEYPSFSVFDVSAGWQFQPQHRVTLKADNIGDKYYVEKGDYPMPGRSLLAQYRYTF